MKLKTVLCFAALSCFGCASRPVTADWVSGQTQTTYDRFQKLTWTVGPFIPYEGTMGYAGNLYLGMSRNDSGGTEFVIGVENTSKTPELFSGAASMTGATLSAQQTGGDLPSQPWDGQGDTAVYQEKVRIIVPKDLLIGCENSGLTVRLYGQRSDLDVTIPAPYIQGFLRKTRT